MSTSLIFERAGLSTTVQDRGRHGAQALGVPVSGALDPVALRLANALVGNNEYAPAFEIRLLGPQIRIQGGSLRVALVGTTTGIEILATDPKRVPSGQAVTLADGDVMSIGAVTDTACCTLAVSGTLDLPMRLGSLSTYAPAGLGGIDGRAVADGDRIGVDGGSDRDAAELAMARPFDYGDASPLRVVLGPQQDYFTAEAMERLLGAGFRVSPTSNRMGLRLDDPVLPHVGPYNMASDGIVSGSIQVPGSGQPIILLADRQTTGGYPKIATVISADLPRLGRAMPGQELRFESVTVESAIDSRRKQERAIQDAIAALRPVVASSDILNRRLLSENLISGAVNAMG